MEIDTTFALHDLVDDIEFIATLHIKENAASYEQTDYLRLKSQCNGSVLRTCSNGDHTWPCFEDKRSLNVKWEMSSAGRLQVGQWFYQST
jgi:hypothetical protein